MTPRTGTVAFVSTKEFKDRRTGDLINLYSFKVDNDDTWYRTGRDAPPCRKGDVIKFVADGQTVDTTSITVESRGPEVAKAPVVTNAVSRDEYWANKEIRDLEKDNRYQNVDVPRMTMSSALYVASHVVESACKEGALSLGNSSKDKKLDLLGDFVEKLADRFYRKIASAPKFAQQEDNQGVSEDTSDNE